jgi:hypothetical protein
MLASDGDRIKDNMKLITINVPTLGRQFMLDDE